MYNVQCTNIFYKTIHKVSGSSSTNIGLAPIIFTELGVATIVKFGTITSSPGLMSTDKAATVRLIVPLFTTTQCLQPVNFAISSSNFWVFLNSVRILLYYTTITRNTRYYFSCK